MQNATAWGHKKGSGPLSLAAAAQRETTEAGQSLMEFALMLPFLCLLLIGVVEIGRAIFITLAATNAATAGAEYGSQNTASASQPTGTPSMTNSALCEANGETNGVCNTTGILTASGITASSGCVCDSGNGVSCASAGWSACADFACDGQTVECVNVTTTAMFDPLFHYPGLPSSFTANGNAVIRVQGQ